VEAPPDNTSLSLSFKMEDPDLQSQALKTIESLLEEWEADYFQNEFVKWIYYTKHNGTASDPPKASYVTTFSQPTAQKPVPRATASVFFEYDPLVGLSFKYETGQLIHTKDSVGILGNPVKRLKEIIVSKEQTADKYSAKLIG
jgi:hypothetical protein